MYYYPKTIAIAIAFPVVLPPPAPSCDPLTQIVLLDSHLSPLLAYVNVAEAPSTVSPAPLAAAASAAPFATVILRSSMSSVVLFIVVVVPSTCKFPAIITVPVSYTHLRAHET